MPGTPIFETPAERVTDPLVDDAWDQLNRLRAGHIAHGRFDGHHLVVDDDHIVVTGFEWASTSAGFGQAAADAANLLAATAAVIGIDRAVAAARRGIDDDGLLARAPDAAAPVDLRLDP